ncbi:uncharacterized protein I303_104437 [Kwoniella dejecticola CBS 10117]|uniref:SET domain-containing protein n=1 Tax=Kwoniella dejecticola CBS 10117 TaxID=1296121 RepID=A0A1A6A5B7_9TREE|nr:uncharacterized protein I303_04584 [Kwoniella dejecticola CBS 10117]OBR85251.1 hypothetical protein I303_04584 [Kwoniella dejecticola CBS 10117]
MTRALAHDSNPPPNWPEGIIYLTKCRLSPTFPTSLIPLISSNGRFLPRSIIHPSSVLIKRIDKVDHPAKGQNGLFAKGKIKPGILIIPYFGIIHATFTLDQSGSQSQSQSQSLSNSGKEGRDRNRVPYQDKDEHEDSDYDLSLLRISASEITNPFPGYHISIGIDAAHMGNAARFVNDYRGINDSGGPNAEFRLGKGENGELQMEIWSLPLKLNKKNRGNQVTAAAAATGISKGDEILVSYGKGWWGARNQGT